MDFVPIVAMGALLLKLVDFLRYVSGRDLNAAVTQGVVWLAGVVVVMLVAHTNWGPGIVVAGVVLSKLSFWAQVFYGLAVSSVASAAKDGIKAVDHTQSALAPALLNPTPRRTPPAPPTGG